MSSGRPVRQRDGSLLRQHADSEAPGIVGGTTSEHHGSGVRAPPLISTCSTHRWTGWAAHAWISSLLCWNVDSVAVTLSHASFFLGCLFFLFAQKNRKFRETQTREGKESRRWWGEELRVSGLAKTLKASLCCFRGVKIKPESFFCKSPLHEGLCRGFLVYILGSQQGQFKGSDLWTR